MKYQAQHLKVEETTVLHPALAGGAARFVVAAGLAGILVAGAPAVALAEGETDAAPAGVELAAQSETSDATDETVPPAETPTPDPEPETSAPAPEPSLVGRASIAWTTTRPALLTNWTTGFPGGVVPPSFAGVTSLSSKPWTMRSMAASRE